jgi:hypothetical protein
VGPLLATTKDIDPQAFMAGGPLKLESRSINAVMFNDGSSVGH